MNKNITSFYDGICQGAQAEGPTKPSLSVRLFSGGIRLLTKICTRCGGTYNAARGCPCRKDRQRHKEYDMTRRNPDAASVYHGREWARLVKMAKARFFGCDVYEFALTGRAVPIRGGSIVHHIVEVEEDMTKAFDISNLALVSRSNHLKIHARYNRGEDDKKRLQAILASATARLAAM